MSERKDRGRSGGRLLILSAAVIIIAAAIGGYLWYRSTGGLLPVPAPAEQGQQNVPSARMDEPIQVTLFVPANGVLAPVTVGARRQPDLQLEARDAVIAILAGDRGGQAAVLRDLRLRALYLDMAGTAFVDLSPAGQREVRASAWDELLAIYAVVNTLTQNFPEVKQVRLLLDGRESQTLAGHVDLARSFVRRQDLVKSN